MLLTKKPTEHKVYILLTDYPDNVSKFLKRVGFWKYSHSSISTSMMNNVYYSFVGKKGFHIENPVEHPTYKGEIVYCALYAIPVSESVCMKITNDLKHHIGRSENYKYSYAGLAMMYFGSKYRTANSYTCSGFVSRILKDSAILSGSEDKALVKPDDFAKKFKKNRVFKGTLENLVKTVLAPKANA